MLSGQIRSPEDLPPGDYRRNLPRFQADNFVHNLTLVDRVRKIAEEKRVSAGQLALAWVLAQGECVVPIPGTRRIAHLQENLGALDVTLTAEDLARLDEAAPPDGTRGDRYADMSTVDA